MSDVASPEILVGVFREQDWPQETLAVLWNHAIQDQPQSLMWRTGTPVTLNEWIRWFSADHRLVVLPVEKPADGAPTVQDILGIVWLDDIDHGCASGHFWFRKQGMMCRKPLRAGLKALEFAFTTLSFQVLWCKLNANNHVAVKFAQRLGFTMLGEIPLWYGHGDVRYPAAIGYLTALMWQEKKVTHGIFRSI